MVVEAHVIIIRLAALEWDVDIPSEIAIRWGEELTDVLAKDKKTWQTNRAWAAKQDKNTGTDYLSDYVDEWDGDHLVRSILVKKLGFPAYFDEKDNFIPSEYVAKIGRTYKEEMSGLEMTGYA